MLIITDFYLIAINRFTLTFFLHNKKINIFHTYFTALKNFNNNIIASEKNLNYLRRHSES